MRESVSLMSRALYTRLIGVVIQFVLAEKKTIFLIIPDFICSGMICPADTPEGEVNNF
jgi:hypothetical protein